MTTQLLYVAMMLMVTIAFFVGLMFLLKYLKKIGPKLSSSIEILGGASVSHKAKVVIIRSGDKKILLGVTDSHISKLHVFEQGEDFTETLKSAKESSLCIE